MLYNFLDVEQFQPGAPPGRQKLIEELRLPEGSFVPLNNDLFLGLKAAKVLVTNVFICDSIRPRKIAGGKLPSKADLFGLRLGK